jgi:membrane-associated phospholipid phosphatase
VLQDAWLQLRYTMYAMPIFKPKFANPTHKAARLIAVCVFFWTPVILFLKLAKETTEKEPLAIDSTIPFWIHSHATPLWDRVFFVITTAGNVEILGAATLLLVVWLLYKNQRLNACIVFFSVVGAAGANVVLKLLFHRTRPTFWHSLITETGYSFPSSHALLSCALVLSIIAITWHMSMRWVVVIAGGIVIGLIGVSRLYLGVHYPSDIIAGWCVSLAWVIIVYITVTWLFHRLHKTYK